LRNVHFTFLVFVNKLLININFLKIRFFLKEWDISHVYEYFCTHCIRIDKCTCTNENNITARGTIVCSLQFAIKIWPHSILENANFIVPVRKAISANCSFLLHTLPPEISRPGWDASFEMQKDRYQFLKRHAYSCVRIICKTRRKLWQIFARRLRHFPRE